MLLFQDEHGNEIQEISYDKSWLVQKWYEFDVKYPFQWTSWKLDISFGYIWQNEDFMSLTFVTVIIQNCRTELWVSPELWCTNITRVICSCRYQNGISMKRITCITSITRVTCSYKYQYGVSITRIMCTTSVTRVMCQYRYQNGISVTRIICITSITRIMCSHRYQWY